MNEDYLSALALLKSSYDERGSTYVDYVSPFVADSIRAAGASSVTTSDIRDLLVDRYGLELPDGVLNTLTRRLARSGYGSRSQGAFHPDREKLEEFNFDEKRSETEASIRRMAQTFMDFVRDELDRTIGMPEAIASLTAHAERNGLPILQHAMRDKALTTSLSLDDLEYMASRFVVHAFENGLPERETLVVLAKGSKLASVLYLPDPNQVTKKFENLGALLDTPTVLSALGYQGSQSESATRQVLDLAYEQGVEVAVFEHTVQEVENVLNAVGHQVGRRGFTGRQLRGVEAHFLELGYNASDIKLLAATLAEDLRALRIRIVEKPPVKAEYSIDESSFEEWLLRNVRYPRKETMRFDLESITATFRLRRARLPRSFETSAAVFVSPNVPLVRCSHQFFKNEYGNHSPIGITEDDFATLLWLKSPLAAPDLPAHQLLADAYAALDPGSDSWERYLTELDRLKARGDISEEHFFLLRYSSEARQSLMEETIGEPGGVSAETVHKVVDRVRRQIARPIEEQAAIERRQQEALLEAQQQLESDLRRELTQSNLSQAQAREDAARARTELRQHLDRQRRSARNRAQVFGRNCRRAVNGAVVALFVCGLWFSAPADWDLPPSDPPRLIVLTARVAVAAVILGTLASLVLGWHLQTTTRRLELWASRRREAQLLDRAGLERNEEV